MTWLIAQLRRRLVSILVLLAMAGVWQILSTIYTAEAVPGEPMVPGWQIVFSRTLLSLSDYWQGGLGVPSVAEGAPQSYLAALLSILDHSVDTIVRLYVGLLIGGLVGSLLGMAVSWSPWTRRIVDLPVQLLRTLPLLAMVPMFQLWFGIDFVGKIAFVGYGVGVIFFAGVVNAVKNVPQIYIDNARTLGASRLQIYRTVVLPAIFPEMRGTHPAQPRHRLGGGARRGIPGRPVRARLRDHLLRAVRLSGQDVRGGADLRVLRLDQLRHLRPAIEMAAAMDATGGARGRPRLKPPRARADPSSATSKGVKAS